jgi:hypothetical protein
MATTSRNAIESCQGDSEDSRITDRQVLKTIGEYPVSRKKPSAAQVTEPVRSEKTAGIFRVIIDRRDR